MAAGIGLCALDRTRTPIRADDVRACWQAIEVVEPPRGLFAMVEALEATARSESADHREPEEGTSGLDRLRRLVFPGGGSSGSHDPVDDDLREVPVGPPVVAHPPPESDRPDTRYAVPPPPPTGQLHDAQPVTPALRLTYRGDARTLKEAALEAVNNQRSRRVGAR